VVENVVGHWQPDDSFTSVAHVACEFMNEVGLRSVVCESTHSSTDSDDDGEHSSCEIVEKVHIPGASYLHVLFDPRSVFYIFVFSAIIWHSLYKQADMFISELCESLTVTDTLALCQAVYVSVGYDTN